jgi:AdoMet-dependent rRNA methyltransferase SPB1
MQKPSKSAEGYPDDARILYKVTPVVDFITGDDHLTILSSSNKLVFDKTSEVFSKHPLTSDEIKQNCEDLKVLGPRELKQLVKWREKMRRFLDDAGSDSDGGEGGDGVRSEGAGEEGEREGEDKMLEGIDDKIKLLEKSEAAEVKRYVHSICRIESFSKHIR